MVVEEDHALHPRISILSNKIYLPPPPPGSNLPLNHTHVKHGPIGIFRKPLDRTTTVRNSSDSNNNFGNTYAFSLNHSKTEGLGGGTSQFSEIAHDSFTWVNSKYGRQKEPVNMDSMLSRAEQKPYLSLETPIPTNPIHRALE
jgi:hypothetical protein